MKCIIIDGIADLFGFNELVQFKNKHLWIKKLYCALLNLCINLFFNRKNAKDPRVERMISVCKKVVSTFSFSWKKKRELSNAQTEPKLSQQKLITESQHDGVQHDWESSWQGKGHFSGPEGRQEDETFGAIMARHWRDEVCEKGHWETLLMHSRVRTMWVYPM